jgi:hypothetical protein
VALLGDAPTPIYDELGKKARKSLLGAAARQADPDLRQAQHKQGSGILFPIDAEAMTGLVGPQHGEILGGKARLEVMIEGALYGMLTVGRRLDGKGGGFRRASGDRNDFQPVHKTGVVATKRNWPAHPRGPILSTSLRVGPMTAS